MKSIGLKYLILFCALSAILVDFLDYQLLYSVFKSLTTFLIILLVVRFRNSNSYSKRILLGLIFCLFGDSFLLFENYFIFGLASFLIGHLFFLYAFINVQGWQWPIKTGGILVVVALAILALSYANLDALLIPVLFYISIIVLMSWQGIALTQSGVPAYKNLSWAVSLFLLSDGLLALNKFYIPFVFSGIIILSTYWLAIFLLAETTIE